MPKMALNVKFIIDDKKQSKLSIQGSILGQISGIKKPPPKF
jgi:hypothetical protein